MEVDETKARNIATHFFGQYHSVIDTRAIRQDDRWIVYVSLQGGGDKEVIIDAENGRILSWNLASRQIK